MLLMAGGMAYLFRRKGWLGRTDEEVTGEEPGTSTDPASGDLLSAAYVAAPWRGETKPER